MLLEHERNYDLGMDALETVCARNTNGIMIWAWMLWEASELLAQIPRPPARMREAIMIGLCDKQSAEA